MLATTLKNSLPTKKPIDIVGNTLTKKSTFRRQNPYYTPDRRKKHPPVWGCAPRA
jgi:hypothetical protein